MAEDTQARGGSIIDPSYTSGAYFSDGHRGSDDAQFKVNEFFKVFERFAGKYTFRINSFADIGCGSGDVIKKIAERLNAANPGAIAFKGYDVSPHIKTVKNEGIEYIHGDFCASDEMVDMVTLFDVFEHVPDPVGFIREIAKRCKIIAFHIPLDNCLNGSLRNLYRSKLDNPGHLIFLDAAAALNMLALAGLRTVDYKYTFGFLAPSGHRSFIAKLAYPVRYILAKISPWLLQKTLGGAAMMAIALTPRGLREIELQSK